MVLRIQLEYVNSYFPYFMKRKIRQNEPILYILQEFLPSYDKPKSEFTLTSENQYLILAICNGTFLLKIEMYFPDLKIDLMYLYP